MSSSTVGTTGAKSILMSPQAPPSPVVVDAPDPPTPEGSNMPPAPPLPLLLPLGASHRPEPPHSWPEPHSPPLGEQSAVQ